MEWLVFCSIPSGIPVQDGLVEGHTFKSLVVNPKFAFTGMKSFGVGMANVGGKFS